MTTQTAIFAAGCFWGVEDTFRSVPGVTNVTVGYSGGSTVMPTYQEVCTGRTGHAEAVLVEFDDTTVTYDQLLDTFFTTHNPTTKNRQGWDRGSQYRSAVFTNSEDEALAAKKAIERHQPSFKKAIVTEVTQAGPFWRGEHYHQQYFAKHGISACHI